MQCSTIISRKATDILSHLSHLRTTSASRIPFYSLSVSPHIAADDLSALVKELTSLSDRGIGCLSAPIPSLDPETCEAISCSIALFDAKTATPFRSTIPGKKAPQVGRWHAFRKREEETTEAAQPMQDVNSVNWENVWSPQPGGAALPKEIQELDPETISSVLYLSDDAYEGLSNALHTVSSATKVGLLASSTPFVTGRPFTLLHGSSIHSSGAVGVCITSPSSPRSFVEFPGLVGLTEPMVVTWCDGNLVQSLDGKNPSRILLDAIQKNRNTPTIKSSALESMKDDQYYLAALNIGEQASEIDQLYTIASGDPSRGTMALEGDTAPLAGTHVQIFQLSAGVSPDILKWCSRADLSTLRMTFAVAPSDPEQLSSQITEGKPLVLKNSFLAASENGFIVDHQLWKHSRPWRCTVRGGLLGLTW